MSALQPQASSSSLAAKDNDDENDIMGPSGEATSSSSQQKQTRKRGRGRPKGRKTKSHPNLIRPRRPRSAYNFYFQYERSLILESHGVTDPNNSNNDPIVSNTEEQQNPFANLVKNDFQETEDDSRGNKHVAVDGSAVGTSPSDPGLGSHNNDTSSHVVDRDGTSNKKPKKTRRGRPRGVNYRPRKSTIRHGLIDFHEFASTIGAKWKTMDAADKKTFEDQAKIELDHYRIAMKRYNSQVKAINEEKGKKFQEQKEQEKQQQHKTSLTSAMLPPPSSSLSSSSPKNHVSPWGRSTDDKKNASLATLQGNCAPTFVASSAFPPPDVLDDSSMRYLLSETLQGNLPTTSFTTAVHPHIPNSIPSVSAFLSMMKRAQQLQEDPSNLLMSNQNQKRKKEKHKNNHTIPIGSTKNLGQVPKGTFPVAAAAVPLVVPEDSSKRISSKSTLGIISSTSSTTTTTEYSVDNLPNASVLVDFAERAWLL